MLIYLTNPHLMYVYKKGVFAHIVKMFIKYSVIILKQVNSKNWLQLEKYWIETLYTHHDENYVAWD